MNVEIRNLPKMRLACIRHIGPYPEIGPVFERLGRWVGENQVPVEGMIGVWLDNPMDVPADQLRSDACAIVPLDFTTNTPGITLVDVEPNEYAVASYYGSYEGLGEAWSKFTSELLPATGRQFGPGICFEKYVGDCSKLPPEQVLTELYTPVAPVPAQV